MNELQDIYTTIANLKCGHDYIRDNVPEELINMRYYRSTDKRAWTLQHSGRYFISEW